jgi:hypothetical protein
LLSDDVAQARLRELIRVRELIRAIFNDVLQPGSCVALL